MNQIAKQVGKAFLKDRQWYVEKEDGTTLQVIGGDVGRTHNILLRGKDENRSVYFDEISGWASVTGFQSAREREENRETDTSKSKVYGNVLSPGPYGPNSVIGKMEVAHAGNLVLRVGKMNHFDLSWIQTEHVVLTPSEVDEFIAEIRALGFVTTAPDLAEIG